MLSIIIPALNEEKYLPLLLRSVKRQKFYDYEIILADAGSEDKTLQIAQKYGCKIIPGGLPAKGKNEGAKISKGDVLFFLDADSKLPDDFFKKAIEEFNERDLDTASFCLIPMPKRRISSLLLNVFYNKPIVLIGGVLPHAAMGILIKKDIFKKIGGFDEDIKLAEDHYLVRQAKKTAKAKFGIIKTTELFVSDRRFITDGWVKTFLKFFLCELHLIFIGPVKSDVFNYKFNHYNKNKN